MNARHVVVLSCEERPALARMNMLGKFVTDAEARCWFRPRHLETDVQFGVTEATTGRYVRHDAGQLACAADGLAGRFKHA